MNGSKKQRLCVCAKTKGERYGEASERIGKRWSAAGSVADCDHDGIGGWLWRLGQHGRRTDRNVHTDGDADIPASGNQHDCAHGDRNCASFHRNADPDGYRHHNANRNRHGHAAHGVHVRPPARPTAVARRADRGRSVAAFERRCQPTVRHARRRADHGHPLDRERRSVGQHRQRRCRNTSTRRRRARGAGDAPHGGGLRNRGVAESRSV